MGLLVVTRCPSISQLCLFAKALGVQRMFHQGIIFSTSVFSRTQEEKLLKGVSPLTKALGDVRVVRLRGSRAA